MPSRVIVLGGGVAGMSAAHELSERGFEVIVLERRRIAGGKARSIPVIDDGSGASGHKRADAGITSIQHRLPGEHGFRFFPGFYKHVIDTMRRIPSFDGRQVTDHLVPTTASASPNMASLLFSYRRSFRRGQAMPARCCATFS